ncbi:MAG: hypothetical protein EA383_01840 [Spirochaetaceae bacterium]|nr:MAG: hypothetical protein EA383_01840 [Spirochaetaceae bacterium]
MGISEQKMGQASWMVETNTIQAWVTEQGGMMAPVTFRLPSGRTVEPYYVAPWYDENREVEPAVLGPLRGDFFCLPFGADNAVGSEDHQPHGESAYATWRLLERASHDDAQTLSLGIDYQACAGSITKNLHFSEGHAVIRTEHVIRGFSGRYPLGHHATLHGGSGGAIWRIYTAPFDYGATDPSFVEPAAGGEYHALEPGVSFDSLDSIPTRWKGVADADGSRFPARRGFIDLYAVYRTPPDEPEKRIAWSAAYNRDEHYLWFSVKDASVLPATVFWVENGGRHQAPWDGRNSCIGIEETCTYFAAGRRESVDDNDVSRRGIPTAVSLDADRRTVIRTVQGVLEIPEEPDSVEFLTDAEGMLVCRVNGGAMLPTGVERSAALSAL